MIKFLLHVWLFTFVLAIKVNGQYVKPYYQEADTVQKYRAEKKNRKYTATASRALIVVMQEEDPGKLNSYKGNSERIAFYRAMIERNNTLLRTLVPQLWPERTAIEFKKYSECRQLRKSGSKEYITLDFTSLKEYDIPFLKQATGNLNEYRNALLKTAGDFGKFEVSLIEKFEKASVFEFTTTTSLPNELDYRVALSQIRNFFQAKYADSTLSNVAYEASVFDRSERLNYRTLLVDSAQTDFRYGFDLKDAVGNYDPFVVKLSGSEEILKALASGDTSYCFLYIDPLLSWTGKDNTYSSTTGGGMSEGSGEKVTSYVHYIIDCKDRQPIFFARNQGRLLDKAGWQLNYNHILKLYNLRIIR